MITIAIKRCQNISMLATASFEAGRLITKSGFKLEVACVILFSRSYG